jgi:hypothetical protein
MLKSLFIVGVGFVVSGLIAQEAGANSGKFIDATRGGRLESCLQNKFRRARVTKVENLRPGETWACVTLSYFWDDNNHATRFVENYSSGNYRFERAVLEHGNESLLYTRNVFEPANPVDFTVFMTPEQSGVREDIRLGMEHSIDFIIAESANYLLVERSLDNSPLNHRIRPSFGENPLAWLDQPAAREFEHRTGRSEPGLYRRVTQYLGCYLTARPETKAQVPCFGDLDQSL